MGTTATARRNPGRARAWRRDGAKALWDAHRDNPTVDTRNRLVEWYYPMIRYHARRVGKGLWGHVEADDLIGPGAVGLMQAIETFDESRGVKFSTWAYPRIVGEMRDELRRGDWRGRNVRARVRMIQDAREELTRSVGHAPTDEEIGDHLGIDADELRRAIVDAKFRFKSVNKMICHADNGAREITLGHVLPDERAESPDAGTLREDMWGLACRSLSDRQREILGAYYREDLTLAQISRRMGLTESRVSQLHGELIRHIRECFADRLIAYVG